MAETKGILIGGALALIVLAILVAMGMLVMSEINDATDDDYTTNTVNDTTVLVSGADTALDGNSKFGCALTSISLRGGSDNSTNIVIDAGNYTYTNCYIRGTAGISSGLNNTGVNVTYTYTHGDTTINNAVNDSAIGISGFIDWYDIIVIMLVVAVIFSLLALGIMAISGIGGGSGAVGGSGSGGMVNY